MCVCNNFDAFLFFCTFIAHAREVSGARKRSFVATATVGMAADEEGGVADSVATEFATYDDFLDSQVTPTDLYYLEVYVAGSVRAPRWLGGMCESVYILFSAPSTSCLLPRVS